MPRRTKAESEATAAAVLASARKLFATRGYAAVGLEEVAVAAGVTRGAVYHHYGSKRRLFDEVLAATHAEVGAAVAAAADRAAAGGAGSWAAFEAGCRAFLELSVSPRIRRILLVDGPAVVGWAAWRGHDAAASAHHLDDALRELADDGSLAAPSVAAAGALLSGAMNEAVLWVAAQPPRGRKPALEEAWSTLQVLLGGLRAR